MSQPNFISVLFQIQLSKPSGSNLIRMSRFSLEDCDSWSRLSTVTSETAFTTHVFIAENFDEVIKNSKIGSSVKSSIFEIEGTKWSIEVNPAGFDESSKEFISIWIRNGNDQAYSINGTVSCCDIQLKLDGSSIPPKTNFGWNYALKKADCLKKLENKEFHVKAEIAIVRKGEETIVSGKGMAEKKENVKASKLMESICTSKVYSDFKLVSNGTEFECHKIFIASQSETFKNVIDRWAPDGKMIMDEYSPEVVENLLCHCYCRPLSQDVFEVNVVEFLNIGEKYDLPDLKAKAEIFMISNMKKETLIEFLVASDLFKASKVKETAMKFLSMNKSIVKENFNEWKEQLKGKEELLLEMFTATCS